MVAGTSAGEREPSRRPGPEVDWHLPAHVRDAAGVRTRVVAQIAAGADIVVAQTYLTHRRALARVGEARRSNEITRAAVTVARSAVEEGVARREAEAPHAVLVAGVISALGDDQGTGRLGTVDGALARDLAEHAGTLAESGVDLVIVEWSSEVAVVAALTAVAVAGLPAWVETPPESLMPILEREPRLVLLGAVPAETKLEVPFGWSVAAASDVTAPVTDVTASVTAWLEAGATAIHLGDGATPERLTAIRTAIDTFLEARDADSRAAGAHWDAWIGRAADLAPGGEALWVGNAPPTLATGWQWQVVPPSEGPRLPHGRYRFVVLDPSVSMSMSVAADLLDFDGVLVGLAVDVLPPALRLIDRGLVGDSIMMICRREGG
ncbi:MAG: homocysteine S-methyltransferase family protein [Candidatus Limnocylindrales bacterium]